ncbi:MAG: hypothetical protein WAU30_12785 [Propionicimonas sp.]|nr:hypothetical protein [Propionibacteriaceae bacterium]
MGELIERRSVNCTSQFFARGVDPETRRSGIGADRIVESIAGVKRS